MKMLLLLSFALSALVAPLAAQDAVKPKNPKAKPAKKAPAKKKKSGAMTQVNDIDGLPRVLLIGDSISIGYTVAARQALKGKANVHRPLTNCGPTSKGVAELDKWLATGGADKNWDVIHFNWGLHDLKYMGPKGQNLADPKAADSKPQISAEDYEKNLDTLVTKMKKTGATLIWRSTTPVPKGAKGRVVGDSAKYNDIAAKVMKKHGVQTHDLYALALEKADEIQQPANVHYNPKGSIVLGKDVARVIEKELESSQ